MGADMRVRVGVRRRVMSGVRKGGCERELRWEGMRGQEDGRENG